MHFLKFYLFFAAELVLHRVRYWIRNKTFSFYFLPMSLATILENFLLLVFTVNNILIKKVNLYIKEWTGKKTLEKKNTVPFSIKLFIFWSSSEFGEPEPMSEDRMKWIYV